MSAIEIALLSTGIAKLVDTAVSSLEARGEKSSGDKLDKFLRMAETRFSRAVEEIVRLSLIEQDVRGIAIKLHSAQSAFKDFNATHEERYFRTAEEHMRQVESSLTVITKAFLAKTGGCYIPWKDAHRSVACRLIDLLSIAAPLHLIILDMQNQLDIEAKKSSRDYTRKVESQIQETTEKIKEKIQQEYQRNLETHRKIATINLGVKFLEKLPASVHIPKPKHLFDTIDQNSDFAKHAEGEFKGITELHPLQTYLEPYISLSELAIIINELKKDPQYLAKETRAIKRELEEQRAKDEASEIAKATQKIRETAFDGTYKKPIIDRATGYTKILAILFHSLLCSAVYNEKKNTGLGTEMFTKVGGEVLEKLIKELHKASGYHNFVLDKEMPTFARSRGIYSLGNTIDPSSLPSVSDIREAENSELDLSGTFAFGSPMAGAGGDFRVNTPGCTIC